jgi:hypothetical protein
MLTLREIKTPFISRRILLKETVHSELKTALEVWLEMRQKRDKVRSDSRQSGLETPGLLKQIQKSTGFLPNVLLGLMDNLSERKWYLADLSGRAV